MARTQTLDEYTLAAFISGSLTPRRRRQVAQHLAHDDDDRTLLHMAMEALSAATPAASANFPLSASKAA